MSCIECPLRLEVVERGTDTSGAITDITLAVVHAPAEGAARGRIADIRIQADRFVALARVDAGDALAKTGKELFVDPVSGDPWQQLSPGVFQLLVISRTDMRRLEAGELVRLRFALEQPVGDVSFRLVERDEVFAPADANTVLQATAYDAPVVVR